jgi:hypothetical protein
MQELFSWLIHPFINGPGSWSLDALLESKFSKHEDVKLIRRRPSNQPEAAAD